MAGNVKNMGLTSLDDLFKSEQERQQDTNERILNIPIGEIYPYARQPYSIKRPTPDLVRLMDSIEQVGVAEPLIVRPRTEGGYEIISGHRRDYCARTVGLESLPVIVREYTDDEADILVYRHRHLYRHGHQQIRHRLCGYGKLCGRSHQGEYRCDYLRRLFCKPSKGLSNGSRGWKTQRRS